MIQIQQCEGKCCFYVPINASLKVRTRMEDPYYPAILIPAVPFSSLPSYGLEPVQVGTDEIGNNGCIHANWQGTILSSEIDINHFVENHRGTYSKSDFALSIYGPLNGNNSTVYATSILPWGSKSSRVEKFFVTGLSEPYDIHHEWFMYEGFYCHKHWAYYKSGAYDITTHSVVLYDYTVSSSTVRLYGSRNFVGTVLEHVDVIDWDALFIEAFGRMMDKDYTVVLDIECRNKAIPHDSSSLETLLRKATANLLDSRPDVDLALEFGLLADIAADDAQQIDVNTPVLLKELLNLKEEAEGIYDLLRGKMSIKTISSLYLSFKYGARLTVADTRELLECVGRELELPEDPWRSCRARNHETLLTDTGYFRRQKSYEIFYNPYDQEYLSLARKLYDWDLMPSLQNVWDMVPFSFVIDWFVDVEGFVNRIDNISYLCTLDILSTMASIRDEFPPFEITQFCDSNTGSYFGNAAFVYYDRMLSKDVLFPPVRIDAPTVKNFSHWWEAAALIVQRRR